MYNPETEEYKHHLKTYGSHKEFGYKDFIPMFKGEKFDAAKWSELFRKSGAKCASTHRAEHFFFMNMGRFIESDVTDEEYRDFYGPAYLCPELHGNKIFTTCEDVFSVGPTREWMEDWLVRTCELIDKYKPKILYFDWWIQQQNFKPYLKKLCAYYYNRANEWGEEVTIDYKHEAFPPGVATFDVERGTLTDILPVPWQTDTAIGKKSWGYAENNEFKESRTLIENLDFRFTYKNGFLYAFQMRPTGTEAIIKSLKIRGERDFLIESVSVLGGYETLGIDRTSEGLKIRLSEDMQGKLPICFKVEIS